MQQQPGTTGSAAPADGPEVDLPRRVRVDSRAEPPLSPASRSESAFRAICMLKRRPCCPRVTRGSWAGTWRRQLHLVFSGNTRSWSGLVVTLLVTVATLLSIALMVVSTLPDYRLRVLRRETGPIEAAFHICEQVIVAIFAIDYGVRLLTVSAMRHHDVTKSASAAVQPPADAPPLSPTSTSRSAAAGVGFELPAIRLVVAPESAGSPIASPGRSGDGGDPMTPSPADRQPIDDFALTSRTAESMEVGGFSPRNAEGATGTGVKSTVATSAWYPVRYPRPFEQRRMLCCGGRCAFPLCSGLPSWRTLAVTARYALSPLSLVDLASFLPSFFDLSGSEDVANTTILRVVRIVRVLLLFKIAGRTEAFMVVLRTLKASLGALLLMLVYVVIVCMFFRCGRDASALPHRVRVQTRTHVPARPHTPAPQRPHLLLRVWRL